MNGFHHKWPGSFYSLTKLLLTLSFCVCAQAVNCKINADSNETCACYLVDGPPWSHDPVIPAPKPSDASVKFAGTESMRPKFTWTYRGQDLESLDGFYFEIFLVGIGTISNYRCDVSAEGISQSEPVVFKFDDCCPAYLDDFREGDNVSIKVHAVPMYNREDESYFAIGEGTVPVSGPQTSEREREYPNKRRRHRNERNRTRLHIRRRKMGESTMAPQDELDIHNIHDRIRLHSKHRNMDESTMAPQQELDETVHNKGDTSTTNLTIAVAVLSTFLFSVFLFAAYRCFEKRRKALRREPSDEMEPHHILVIGDEYGGKYTAFINGVVEKLKKYGRGNTEVTTNVRKMTEIGKERIVQWISRNISENDIVVLIIVDPEQVQTEDIEAECGVGIVSVTLSVAESETLKSNFKKSKKKFLTLSAVSHQKNIPFCTQFNFENDLKTFFHHSLGPHYQYALTNEDSNALQAMLKKAQSIPKNPGAIPKKRDNDKTEFLNDLGDSILYHDNEVTIAPYVSREYNYEVQNGATSMECNSCKT